MRHWSSTPMHAETCLNCSIPFKPEGRCWIQWPHGELVVYAWMRPPCWSGLMRLVMRQADVYVECHCTHLARYTRRLSEEVRRTHGYRGIDDSALNEEVTHAANKTLLAIVHTYAPPEPETDDYEPARATYAPSDPGPHTFFPWTRRSKCST